MPEKTKLLVAKIRTEFENNQINEELLKRLYQQYNHLNDINAFVRKAKNSFPHLNCGLATVYLKGILQKGRIVNGKYKKYNHTFLIIGKKMVIDITSDQYGGPKIYVGPLRDPWSL